MCVTTHHYPDNPQIGGRVAIDLGTTNLATTDRGVVIRGPTHQKHYDTQIDKVKSKRDKTCKKNSRRFNHLSKVVRKLHTVKARKTNDSLHKISKDLSRRYQVAIVEKLPIKRMSETEATGRNRVTRNSCIARFIDMLRYKMHKLLEVNPAHTSQVCSLCRHHLEYKLKLKDRTFKCPKCHLTLDRDQNAALNILQLGIVRLHNLHREDVSIVDIEPGMWLDIDSRRCLEQAMA